MSAYQTGRDHRSPLERRMAEAGDIAIPEDADEVGSDNPETYSVSLRGAVSASRIIEMPLETRRAYQASRIRSIERMQQNMPGAVERLRSQGLEPYNALTDAARYGVVELQPGLVEVWYVKGAALDREAITMEGPRAVNGGLLTMTHACLGSVKGGDSPDELFSALQGEAWSPNGDACALIASKGLLHTSMSVGDALRYPDGKILVVAHAGFRAPEMPAPLWLGRFNDAIEGLIRHNKGDLGAFLSSAEVSARVKTAPGCQDLAAWVGEGFNTLLGVKHHLNTLRDARLVQVGVAADQGIGYRLRQKDEPFNLTAYRVSPTYGGPQMGGWGYESYQALATTRVIPQTVAQELAQLQDRVGGEGLVAGRRGERVVILDEEADAVGGFAVTRPPEWN